MKACPNPREDRQTSLHTLERIQEYCRQSPSVYLPSHDPDTPDRLANQQLAVATTQPADLQFAAV